MRVTAPRNRQNPAGDGEVALIDKTSRVARLGRVFFHGLFDENSACHLAYGHGFRRCVEDTEAPGLNESAIHTDFMVGGPEMTVLGVTADGAERSIVVENEWRLT